MLVSSTSGHNVAATITQMKYHKAHDLQYCLEAKRTSKVLSLFFSPIGLYRAVIVAVPMPASNSAIYPNTWFIDESNPFVSEPQPIKTILYVTMLRIKSIPYVIIDEIAFIAIRLFLNILYSLLAVYCFRYHSHNSRYHLRLMTMYFR